MSLNNVQSHIFRKKWTSIWFHRYCTSLCTHNTQHDVHAIVWATCAVCNLHKCLLFIFGSILDVFQIAFASVCVCETLDKFECRILQKCTLTTVTACKVKTIKIHTHRANWVLFLIIRCSVLCFHAAHRFIWLFFLFLFSF